MSALDTLSELARTEAAHHLGVGAVERVQVDDETDWNGDDVLRFRMIVAPGAADHFDGDTLVAIGHAVARSCDPRRVTLEYADETELAALESD